MDGYDAEKVVGCMFDPVTSKVIALLEDGPVGLARLAEESGVPQDEVLERLSYLTLHGFIKKETVGGAVTISADGEKLAFAAENSSSFDGAVDSITTMDSYLN